MKNRSIFKYSIIVLTLLFVTTYSQAQTYSYSEISNKGQEEFKKEVGEKLFPYFKMYSTIYYEHNPTIGRSKLHLLEPGQDVKAKKIDSVHFYFELHHPELKYLKRELNITAWFSPDFKSRAYSHTEEIPDFIKNGEPCPWLSPDEVDSIINPEVFQTAVKKIEKELVYSYSQQRYYWSVKNYYEKDYEIAFFEYLFINPVTGIIYKRGLSSSRRSCLTL